MFSKPGLRFVKHKIAAHLFPSDKYNPDSYHNWVVRRSDVNKLQQEFTQLSSTFSIRPLISIVIPVYNPPIKYLKEAISSIEAQLYTNWELCIADDLSPNPAIRSFLQSIQNKDNVKICFRTTNGHISECTNSALALVGGDYVLFMDHDDLIPINCLSEIVKYINEHPEVDIIYTDEDKINEQNIFCSPHFKPNWAPDNLLSRNYMGHAVIIRQSLLERVGGLRSEFNGSQDHDLLLRATELTNNIGHIPKVLYHWRIHENSVALAGEVKPYAFIAAQKAINEALVRRGTPGSVSFIPSINGGYRIHYDIINAAKVSIIIPTKDQVPFLKKAIDSILKYQSSLPFEIIVLNNNSTSEDYFEFEQTYGSQHAQVLKFVEANFPFNYSRLMNLGASHSEGKYLLMLNNDVEVIHDGWLETLVSFAQHKHTGAVGAKLWFPDNTIQHAGVVLGLGGAAGHVFARQSKASNGYYNYIISLNNYLAVTGACMMVRKDVFYEVGGFDESLAVEYNDVDFCLKIHEKGYYNLYVPDVQLYHHESVTRGHPFHSKANWEQHEKDFAIFRDKWLKWIENDPFYNPNLSIEHDDFRLKNDDKLLL
jgi:GT2 family glycosyltransferase